MDTKNHHRLTILNHLDTVKVFFLLAITIWIAHFWHCASFGLYEDDYFFVSPAMGMSGAELWNFLLKTDLTSELGRPIIRLFIYPLSFLGAKFGGFYVVYWISYAIVTVNSFLFYALLKRLSQQDIFALTGALAFCLFPADTTKAFLMHSLGLQPSLIFLLLASHCYLSGKTKLSYLIISGSLLCYETVFPVFLAAPLLKKQWDVRLKRELFRHSLVLGAMIACVVIIRKATGESRVSDLNIFTVRTLVRQMLIGPIVSMAMFLYRSVHVLLVLNGELVVLLLLYFLGLVWVLSQLKPYPAGDLLRLKTSVERKAFRLEFLEFFKPFAKLALLGLIMLVLAYPLTFTVFATAIDGRNSRVHLAAVVGASILCACICSVIWFMAIAYRKNRLATVGLAGFFTLLVGFGLIVQQDYKLAWQYQRAFWTDVIRLCPDLSDGTVILVESTALHNPKQIEAYSWSLPLVLDQIYQFPHNWKNPPRVYTVRTGWQENIVANDNLFQLNRAIQEWQPWLQPQPENLVNSSSVILLEAKNEQLARRNKSILIHSQEFALKEMSALEIPPLQKGYLYNYLINSSSEKTINYLNS